MKWVRLINSDYSDQVIDVAQVIQDEEEGKTAVDATSETVSESGKEIGTPYNDSIT